jgi:hypothetical protein
VSYIFYAQQPHALIKSLYTYPDYPRLYFRLPSITSSPRRTLLPMYNEDDALSEVSDADHLSSDDLSLRQDTGGLHRQHNDTTLSGAPEGGGVGGSGVRKGGGEGKKCEEKEFAPRRSGVCTSPLLSNARYITSISNQLLPLLVASLLALYSLLRSSYRTLLVSQAKLMTKSSRRHSLTRLTFGRS